MCFETDLFQCQGARAKKSKVKASQRKNGNGHHVFFSGYESAVQRDVVVGYLYLYAIYNMMIRDVPCVFVV